MWVVRDNTGKLWVKSWHHRLALNLMQSLNDSFFGAKTFTCKEEKE